MPGYRVEAGARLHAGFHTIKDRVHGVDYAGAGFYVSQPRTVVEAWAPCESPRVSGPQHAVAPALQALELVGARDVCVRILSHAPRHVGLGSTTQLMMSVAVAALHAMGRPPAGPEETAWLGVETLGRARGSTVGAYLFAYGGFVLDPGVPPPEGPGQPVRLEVPGEWRFVIVEPRVPGRVREGAAEDAMLELVEPSRPAWSLMEGGLRLLLLGLMRRELETVLDGLRQVQAGTGMAFSRLQGGVYRGDLARIVDEAWRDGIVLAQSSWGPTLYTLTREGWAESDVKTLRMILRELGVPGRVFTVEPRNVGYRVERIG